MEEPSPTGEVFVEDLMNEMSHAKTVYYDSRNGIGEKQHSGHSHNGMKSCLLADSYGYMSIWVKIVM